MAMQQQQSGMATVQSHQQQGTRTRFEGKVEELKKHVYDLSSGHSGTDVFVMTMREIMEYITHTYKGSGEFLMTMDLDTLVFEVSVDPAMTPPPDGDSIAIVEVWKHFPQPKL